MKNYTEMTAYVKSCSDETYEVKDKRKEPTKEVPKSILMIVY